MRLFHKLIRIELVVLHEVRVKVTDENPVSCEDVGITYVLRTVIPVVWRVTRAIRIMDVRAALKKDSKVTNKLLRDDEGWHRHRVVLALDG